MHVRQRLGASERHACHVLGQPRSTQRRVKKLPGDEEALRTDVIRLASRFGRYGYRNLSTTMGHSTGLIKEQFPVWRGVWWED